jgi:two-component system, chemotaxis family, protein-glutamate methylesterase/glutaminase
LPRFTAMPVLLVEDGGILKANHVYLVPPGKDVAMAGNMLRLTSRAARHGWPKNITHFLSSLAADRKTRAIAVILSGFGSDGAGALKAIKASGGIVFAQKFDTAQQPDMPVSAVHTGCVDFLLSPANIATELQHIGEHRARKKTDAATTS